MAPGEKGTEEVFIQRVEAVFAQKSYKSQIEKALKIKYLLIYL